MNASISWLKKYVPDLNVTAQEFTDAMTLSGTKVEGYEILDKDLDNIKVGKIIKVEKHPDADKLVVCQVDIGDETVQIVTGAPNIHVGDEDLLVPVVLDGGRVAGGHDGTKTEGGIKIKTGKLRGVVSQGMMCSVEELGSTKDMFPEAPEDGIYIFGSDDDVKPGDDAIEAFGMHDAVFEFEITSNRVDCYSMIGIARETAATFGCDFKPPVVKETGNAEDTSDYIKVTVKDKELCPRYIARVVKNIKIGPSPKWMQRALRSFGIRPINNLVDITNFIMEEYGQPMHAYDLDHIAGREIIVRRASDGDVFTTLDSQERKLDKNVLMICDGEKEVGIAGIMGGENSMITDEVKTVLFEAACFDGTNIRLSSKRVGLRTDASGKFEKGLDPNNAKEAIDRACALMEEFGAGEVVGGMVDVYDEVRQPSRVAFEPEKINALLGTELSKEQMLAYFSKIELAYDEETNEIVAPTFRQDIKRMADLAEEVARFYGYDNIPTTLPSGQSTFGKLPFKLRIEEKARDLAEYCGFSQGMCYSFESPKVFDKLLIDKDDALRKVVQIRNPLGEDFSIMRTLSLNGMLTSLSTNYNRRNKNVRLYEMGNIYLPHRLPITELPDEQMIFTLGAYGDYDFYDLKGVVEEFFESIGMKGRIHYNTESKRNYLHPGRQADMIYDGIDFGYLGEVHPEVCDNYGIGERTYIAAINIHKILGFASFDYKYEGIAKFPAVTRDISMVVPKNITAGSIEDVITDNGGKYMESFTLFDLYEGSQIEEGYKSMAYSIVFRSKDRTLTDDDITKAMRKVMDGLMALGIELRK